MNNPGNDQNLPEPPAADGPPAAPAEDLELTAPRECPDCRPGALDPLRCRAEGVKAEADYDEQHKDGPSPEQYETARLQYGKARHDAVPLVAAARDKLAHVTEQLRCIIDDSETVECLHDAWRDVRRRLEVCDPQLGCCVDDEGDFDADTDECGTEIVKARIAEYEHRAQVAEDCFKNLLGEPAALTGRVSKLQAEVDGIEAEAGKTEAKSLYARALVARRHLEEIWWGFDHPHDYVDCVCRALRISLRARAALSELTGELAVRTCRQKARHDRCEHLRGKIAEAIIEEYVRRCHPRHRHDDDEHRPHRHHGDDWDDDDEDEDEDRGRRRRDDRGSYRDRGRRDQEYGRRRDEDRDRGYRRDRDPDRDDDRARDRRDRDSYRDRS
ncbi:MAG TPA: hypothetical protein VFV73_15500 [Streptosporangiaceae bacterium]|nr:hypothetical protein [Streptosporangiaceae bacterium]